MIYWLSDSCICWFISLWREPTQPLPIHIKYSFATPVLQLESTHFHSSPVRYWPPVRHDGKARKTNLKLEMNQYWCRQRFILLSRCSFTATVFHWLLQHTGADMTAWALRDFLKSQTHVWEQRWRNILLWCGNLTLERKHFLFNSWIQNIFHRGSGSETSFVLKRGSWSV